MQVLVTPDYQTLSREAAHIVAEAIRLQPALTLGLPAGNTPTGMYEELATSQLDFSKVRTFNIDEYAGLAPADPRSFHAYMRRTFFDRVNLPQRNIHFPDENYEGTIGAAGGIDLIVLGVGLNGHIAFNKKNWLRTFTSRTVSWIWRPRQWLPFGGASRWGLPRLWRPAGSCCWLRVRRRETYSDVRSKNPCRNCYRRVRFNCIPI